ncbi:hypothetical protein HGH93_12025 [Chitinophaga polysaccharea]|uniref:hypothetical protein n=1 Tax=Chitinophaga polysaccharea TaxID=1293035 RepID=UPI001454FAB7|nr:hypothetical protein [Chitinophaga polysaccharea]NLR58834.1 hypothetical protein [Chitinophaga polysaccharea]
MSKHNFTVTIEAKTATDAEQKIKALTALAGKLSVRELSKLAHIVQHDPVKTAQAKIYLNV